MRSLQMYVLALVAVIVLSRGSVRAEAATLNRVSAVRMEESPKGQRVVIECTQTPSFTVFRVLNPARIVVDVAGANTPLSANPIEVVDPLVEKITVAQFADAYSSIVRVTVHLYDIADYEPRAEGDRVLLDLHMPPPLPAPEGQMKAKAPPAPEGEEEDEQAEASCDLKQARTECEQASREQNPRAYWQMDVVSVYKRIFWDAVGALEDSEPKNLPILILDSQGEAQTTFLSGAEGIGETVALPVCKKLTACDQEPSTTEKSLAFSITKIDTWTQAIVSLLMTGFDEPRGHPTHSRWDWDGIVAGYQGPSWYVRRSLHFLTMDEAAFSQAARWVTDRATAVWKLLPDFWHLELTHALAEFMDTALDLNEAAIVSSLPEEDRGYQTTVSSWYRECHRKDMALEPKCDPKKCGESQEGEGESCAYDQWIESQPGMPGLGTDSTLSALVQSTGYERYYFPGSLDGWIFRRYLEGGKDRVTLFLVWGAVAADKVDIPDALRWAQRVQKRLKKTKLDKADYYRERMDDIVARRSK